MTTPRPCRYCGRPSWTSDNDGPVHPCCRYWYEVVGLDHCPACRASQAQRRRRTCSSLSLAIVGEGGAPFRVFDASRPQNRGGSAPIRLALACDRRVTTALGRLSDQDVSTRSGTLNPAGLW